MKYHPLARPKVATNITSLCSQHWHIESVIRLLKGVPVAEQVRRQLCDVGDELLVQICLKLGWFFFTLSSK